MALPSARRSHQPDFARGYTTAAIYAVALLHHGFNNIDGRPGHVQRAGGKSRMDAAIFPSEQLSAIPGHIARHGDKTPPS